MRVALSAQDSLGVSFGNYIKGKMPSDTKQDDTAVEDNVGPAGDASPVKRGRGRPKKANPKPPVSIHRSRTPGNPRYRRGEKTTARTTARTGASLSDR